MASCSHSVASCNCESCVLPNLVRDVPGSFTSIFIKFYLPNLESPTNPLLLR
jgi:hypothetical protein